MRDTTESVGATLVIAAVVLLLLVAGGAAAWMWQRQQVVMARQEALLHEAHAAADAARARAVAEKEMIEAAQNDPAAIRQPRDASDNPDSIEASIRNLLQDQQRAWNAGNIEQFMDAYWQSEKLTFSSGGKLTRSWKDTLENYRAKYPSRGEMGTLSFEELEITPLGSQAALVLGKWRLNRESQDLDGNFTLVFRRLDDRWVIVHDHTSRTEQP